MDKSIQAIDIAAVASGNRKTPNKSAEGGETVPFAEVLSPARERVAESGDGQATAEEGKPLPGEQDLPASQAEQAAAEEAEQVSRLASVLAEQVSPTIVTTATATATATTTTTAIATVSGDLPVAKALTEAPSLTTSTEIKSVNNSISQQLPAADGQLPAAVTARTEAAIATREAADSRNGPPVPLPFQQTAESRSTTAGTELPQAAVRTAVQQALAAQVAQDGLRQSLTGSGRSGKLPSSLATTSSAESVVASFTSTLADATTATGSARIGVPVGTAGWGRAVGEQVVWHVSQNIQAANLRLNPQHLGPLEMQIQMEGDRATVAFTSHHAAVREALESSLPKLREMFAENGMDIVDVNVSQQEASDRQAQDAAATGKPAGDQEQATTDGELLPGMTARSVTSAGLVDYYI